MATTLQEQLKNRILIIDGAMGTMLQRANLTAEDFGGEELEGCNEILCVTRPDVIQYIHEAYLAAGADVIETNSFGATSIVLAEYDIPHRARELNLAAARIAREAADKYSTPERPRFVAGAMGPTTKTLSVTGGATFDQMVESYFEQALALIEGGVDALLLETSQDTLNVKAGGIAIRKAFEASGKQLPIMISGTIEPMGTTLAGQNIESFLVSLEHLQPVSIGLNCATGPEFMKDHIRTLAQLTGAAVSCYPNAGLPDENGDYHETPESLAGKLADFAAQGWLNIVGGCCGTTPEHIRAIAERLKDMPPRRCDGTHPPAVSGTETVYLEPDNKPLLVGERTNVIGSRKFKRLIFEGKFEEASEIARAQVKNGAHIIDVNLEDTELDEKKAMAEFLRLVTKKVKVPLMLDSTNPEVLEIGLKHTQGKAIINSINMEDGLERFERVVPLIHKYGAAVVVGLIDEKGMAVWPEDKLRVAERSYDILVNRYGVNPRDIIFDPNVFPVGSGDPQYIGSAAATIEGVRLLTKRFPECSTILGISNVSFGLPPAGREVLNSVFLYHNTKAGLGYAIVNTEKLERYASIPEEERRLAEDLIFHTSDETLAAFTAYFREKKVAKKEKTTDLTLEERLSSYIVEGTKEGLIPDLDEALKKYAPLEIINGPLMAGMDEVGRLFNNNELIVAEVLQSAEAMKAAVSHLEPHMEKSETAAKGTVVLATVKGDVHDIGKNLVEIILSNNGYDIINLGIKVAPETLIEVVREKSPDIVGLSGLLVKSAQQMLTTAQDLKAAGIDVPILVGGAALTRKFAKTRIAPEYDGLVLYAKDAMEGLELANRLMNPSEREQLVRQHREDLESIAKGEGNTGKTSPAAVPRVSNVSRTVPVSVPRDLERHVLRDYPISHLLPYVNMQMLLGHHLGLKGKVDKLLAERDEKALQLKEVVDGIYDDAIRNGSLKANGVYRFFPAQSQGDAVIVYDPADHKTILQTFVFPRQQVEPYLCLADYLRPAGSGEMDYVGFFVVTAGSGVRERSERYKENGEYLLSHALQAVALETAEAFAERVHQIMRDVWGIPDPANLTIQELFGAKYRGQRFSFGYPACPNLEDQAQLFELLQPGDIGVKLTEGFMMEPEASVSAIVFAHPEARYFNVDKAE